MTYEDLVNKISPSIMGLGHPVAMSMIQRSAQEFCEETEIWRDIKLNVDLSVGQEYYDISFGDDISVVQVRNVYADGVQLTQVSNEDYLNQLVRLETKDSKTSPTQCAFFAPNRIRFLPINGKETKLSVYCSLKPKLSAETMPEDLLESYGTAIESGALRQVYLMKDKPWFDENLSRYHDRKFVLGCQKAKATANKGNTTNNVMINLNELPMG